MPNALPTRMYSPNFLRRVGNLLPTFCGNNLVGNKLPTLQNCHTLRRLEEAKPTSDISSSTISEVARQLLLHCSTVSHPCDHTLFQSSRIKSEQEPSQSNAKTQA